ncbi:MAG: UDP-N-acetylmuramoyl-tripeptide--D-alanyl-D-alanine ligase [Pseudomonadota bacterium]
MSSNPLWTSAEIAAATGGHASADFDVFGLSIDTRTLNAGDLFVALKDVRDGHDFVENAFEEGAEGALVSRPVACDPTVQVDDVLPALENLGTAARDRAPDCFRSAVTGSVAKTSVKDMLARIYRALGPAHANERSFNNQWGVPLTLARMPRNTERAVFEIGMNTPGEIAPRSHIVQPHAALITKIAPAHLEGVGSIQAVAKEKSDIFAGLLPGGAAIIPHEDSFRDYLAEQARAHQPDCRILTFGMSDEADAHVHQIYTDHHSILSVYLKIHGAEVNVELSAIGDHWALNAAAALLLACQDKSVDVFAAAEALSGYTPPAGRGTAEHLKLPSGGTATLIDDAYNANPESMRAALTSLKQRQGARKIVVLGEMLEVGTTSDQEHADLAEPVMATDPSHVFLAGNGIEPLHKALVERTESIWAVKAKDFENQLKNTLKDGDLVLLKGSNASGINRLADRLRQWSASADEQVMESGAGSAARGCDAV